MKEAAGGGGKQEESAERHLKIKIAFSSSVGHTLLCSLFKLSQLLFQRRRRPPFSDMNQNIEAKMSDRGGSFKIKAQQPSRISTMDFILAF